MIIPKCIIQEFGCADGQIGIVQYGRVALLADEHITEGEDIYAQRRRGLMRARSLPQQNPESSLLLSGVPVK